MYIEGINPLLSYTVSLETPMPFRVGQRGKDQQGREFVFCNSLLAVVNGDLLMLPLLTGVVTPLTTAAALYNRQVGIAPVSFGAVATTGTGFWAQVQGPSVGAGIKTAVATAINTPLWTTATSSAATGTAAGGGNLIRGATLTVATGGAAVGAAYLNYPVIGTINDTDNQT